MSKELTAFSLFTGDGGMDVGFERAGIRVVFANELMKEAAQTYNANHPAGVMVNDDVNNVMDQLNEKKAIKLLETFEYKPEKYAERVNHIFEVLGLSLFECYDMTEKLYKEVKKIATEINNFLNEGNSDERKQRSIVK